MFVCSRFKVLRFAILGDLICDKSMPPGVYVKGFLSLVIIAFWTQAGASAIWDCSLCAGRLPDIGGGGGGILKQKQKSPLAVGLIIDICSFQSMAVQTTKFVLIPQIYDGWGSRFSFRQMMNCSFVPKSRNIGNDFFFTWKIDFLKISTSTPLTRFCLYVNCRVNFTNESHHITQMFTTDGSLLPVRVVSDMS